MYHVVLKTFQLIQHQIYLHVSLQVFIFSGFVFPLVLNIFFIWFKVLVKWILFPKRINFSVFLTNRSLSQKRYRGHFLGIIIHKYIKIISVFIKIVLCTCIVLCNLNDIYIFSNANETVRFELKIFISELILCEAARSL